MSDIRLADAQIIWTYEGSRSDAPPVRVVDIQRGPDDQDYISSWGACNSDFNQADDAGRLLMLFQQFHWLTLGYNIDANAIHEAFLVIPEYREAIVPDLLPAQYRQEG